MDHLGDGVRSPSLTYRDLLDVGTELQEQVRLWRNSDGVRCSMVRQDLIDEEGHRRWIDSLRTRKDQQIIRVAFCEGIPFGVVTLKDLDRSMAVGDWGFYIGDPSYRGRGLGRILLFEILRWGFEEEGLVRLYTSVLGSNPKALILYLETGFELEGCWRRHVRTPEGRTDLYWVATFREAWERDRERIARRLLGSCGS